MKSLTKMTATIAKKMMMTKKKKRKEKRKKKSPLITRKKMLYKAQMIRMENLRKALPKRLRALSKISFD